MDPWLLAIGLLLVAVCSGWVAYNRQPLHPPAPDPDRARRALDVLRARAPVAVAAAPEGLVVLEGRIARGDMPLVAPLSGRPCLFYELLVEDLDQNLLGVPETLIHERQGAAFTLEDDTGKADVAFDDAGDVSFVVACDVVKEGQRLRISPAVRQLLAERGVSPTVGLFRRHLYASEAAILPGDAVAVVGVGAREIAAGGEATGYRQPPTRYVVRAAADSALTVVKRSG